MLDGQLVGHYTMALAKWTDDSESIARRPRVVIQSKAKQSKNKG